ncbi:aspartate/glutamate racemase family protein [uncultured Ruegeria sp.]|uniref:maleate cis-trans isomerase family protein n=1 Tax=uncultured Ruegeria sp. TaxID=259304 RepID=UPI00261132D3|nr:aspartate/glutamate racemase family protein [uncultured Ruegeria sp.]
MDASKIFGNSPGEYRIGVVALANDQVIERDLVRMLPREALTFTTRIAFGGHCTLEQLANMAPVLSDAVDLLNPEVELDAVVFGCTSGTIAIGPDNVRSAIRKSSPKAIVVNPVEAACAAFDHLGAKRLNMVTPYESEIADLMAHTFSERGFEIVNRLDFGITGSADISRVTPEAIFKVATSLSTRGVDATFVSCTDFQSLTVLESIETATGLPVISSNQAMVWQLVTHSGLTNSIPGYGRLLENFEKEKTTHQQGEIT